MAPRRNRTALGGAALAALAAGAGAASSAASVVVALSGPGRDGPALQAALPRCLGVGAGADVQLAADGCVFWGVCGRGAGWRGGGGAWGVGAAAHAFFFLSTAKPALSCTSGGLASHRPPPWAVLPRQSGTVHVLPCAWAQWWV